MRNLVLVALAALILGGGGAAGYFYFRQPAEAAIGQTDEHQKAAEAKGHGESKESLGHKFVELDPLILPIVDKNGINQVVSMVVVIEVADERTMALVNTMQPRLKDAYIQELYGVLNPHAALRDGVLQVGMIKDRLSTISHRVMGEGVVQDVLLQVVQQRPI